VFAEILFQVARYDFILTPSEKDDVAAGTVWKIVQGRKRGNSSYFVMFCGLQTALDIFTYS
jgi:hypothetical protein